jgi:NAD(P)-dependent dehydrogenase (short-subunit alcohol dehydrogenase family)
MHQLKDREGRPLVAIVTGGAGGIGSATCRQLARAGAAVLVTDVQSAAGEQVAAGIRAEGLVASYRDLDVGSEQSWAGLREWVLGAHGRPAILVNNAGIDVVKDLMATTVADWNRLFNVNMTGMFIGCRTFTDDLHAEADRTGRHASVINMSSICGLIGVAFQTAYCASKGAVRLFSKALALEYAALGRKIRVNSIHPGTVDTAFAAQCLKELGEVGFAPSPSEARAAIARAHPIGHMAEPDEIADAIVFLASDASRFMTGSELVPDGGYTAQ